MGEARSLTYSINVDANTAQAESNVRNLTSSLGSLQNGGARLNIEADIARAESNIRSVTGNLGGLQSQADSVGSAFRSSFLEGVDTGQSLSASLKSGVGGALSYVEGRVTEFKNSFVQGAENIKNGFTHPIETIKNGLGNAIQSAEDKFIDMVRGAEQAADGADDMGDAAQDAGKDIQGLGNEADSAGGKFEKLGGIAKTAGLAIGAALGVAVGTVGAFGVSAVNTGMEFDSAMSQVSATMGMTTADIAGNINGVGDTFNALRDKAKEMGAATNFSATQAAEGLNILAMSGFDATNSMEMIEDVLHLAAAGGMEMAESADYIAGSMKGFNDSTKDSAYYADLMAKGATLANTSVAELGQAMSGGAATADSYGQSADSMTLALLRLAEQGVVGSAASTTLNAAMKDLYMPTDDAKKALTELGVAVYDQSGKARDMNTVMNELNGALAGMSDEEANAYKSTIFQIQGLQAFNKMTVTSTEKQEEWAAALAGASGEASRQYDTMTDNLQGDIDIWNSSLDGFKIAISDGLTPTIREFVQFGSDSMGKLTEAFEADGISGAMGAFGEILSDGLRMVVDMLPGMVDTGMQLIGALGSGIIDNLPVLIDATLEIIGTVGSGIMDSLPMLIDAATEIIVTLATGIGEALPELIPSVVDTLLTVVDTLIENLPLILDAGMQLLMGLTEGIINAIPLLVERLPEIIISTVDFLTENLPTILEQGSQMLLSLGIGIIEAIPQLVAQLPEIITSIVGFITENLPLIVETGVNLIVQLGVGLIQAIPQLVANLPQIISAIVDGFAQVPGMMLDIGRNIVEGVWNGISAMGSWIKDKVTGFFGGIVDGVKGLLGIHSPSTVFAGIGDNMALGLGQGFENTMGSVTKKIEGAIPTDIDVPVPEVPEVDVPDQKNPPPIIVPKPDNPDDTYSNPSGNFTYSVIPKTEGIHTPAVSDISYNVNSVVDELKLPDASEPVVYKVMPEIDGFSLPEDVSYNVRSIIKDTKVPGVPDMTYGVEADVENIQIPNLPDVSYNVNPVMGDLPVQMVQDITYGVNPAVKDINIPQVSDVTYGVKPVVEKIDTPAVSDISYGVNPVIGDFNPPDTSASVVYGNETAKDTGTGNGGSESSTPAPFAPVITIEVKGNADEKAVEDMRTTLYDTVKELFDEFREQELERMALKNQYAF